MQARHLTIVRYPLEQPWTCVEVRSPHWDDVVDAIRNMDDNEYPIVLLSWQDVASCFDDETSLNIIGGRSAGFALFEHIPGWQFADPAGGDDEVRLWQSDQGYVCRRKNVITDVGEALRLVRVYFDSGSYDAIQSACSAPGRD